MSSSAPAMRRSRRICTSFEELRLHLQKSVSTDLLREREHKMLLANISHD